MSSICHCLFIICNFSKMIWKILFPHCHDCGAGSVVGIAIGYVMDGPWIESRWGARFSAPVQTGPGAHPACCTIGTGSLPGVKSGWGVTLTPHPLLVPWSRKSRAIPLLPLRAVRPVQSLSACTRVHFTTLPLYTTMACTGNFCLPNIIYQSFQKYN